MPGCGSADEGEGESADDIQRGVAARNFPAVGMVRFHSGNFGTGALIRPNVVLTAGHVVGGSLDRFYYGTPPAGQTPLYSNLPSVPIANKAIGECYITAGHSRPASCDDDLDVGLVLLATPIKDVAPLPMFSKNLATLFFDVIKNPVGSAVGFGCHTLADNRTQTYGERRFATSVFDSLTSNLVVVRAGSGIATGGDSGGPLLYNGSIVGTVRGAESVTSDGNACGRLREGYVRIDRTKGWIDRQLKAWNAL